MNTKFNSLLRIATLGGVILGVHWFTVERMGDRIFGGRVRPVEQGLRGEVTTISASLPNGLKATGDAAVSDDGLVAALTIRRADESAAILLWNSDHGYAELTPREVVPIGGASISRDGNRVAFFGDRGPSREAYLWEQGLGLRRIDGVTCHGDWSVQLAGAGERMILVPLGSDAQCKVDPALINGSAVASFQEPLLIEFGPPEFDRRFALELVPLTERALRVRPLGASPTQTVAKVTDSSLLAVSHALRGNTPKLEVSRRHVVKPLVAADIDGDRGDDLLMFAQREGLPVWRAHTMSGSDGPTPVTSAESQKMYTWRVGDGTGYPVPGDYNGDGILDLATFSQGYGSEQRESRGNWRIFLSSPPNTASNRTVNAFKLNPTAGYLTLHWGTGALLPVPADYDGDGLTDLAVFDDDSARWQILFSGGGFNITKAQLELPGFGAIFRLGEKGDQPVVGDYDGDGRTDPAVWSPPKGGEERGQWKVRYLPDSKGAVRRERTISFGMKDDIPIAADYNCDGTTDLGVYRRSESTWIMRLGENAVHRVRWGIDPKEEPIVGDFDADGCVDLGFYFGDGFFRWALLHSQFGAEAKDMLPNGLNVMTAYTYGLKDGWPPQLWLRKLYQRGR